jgi:DnaK suppressor protein
MDQLAMAIRNHGLLGGYKQEQWRCGTMELNRARSLVDAERTHVQQLLADLGAARTDDHDAERDAAYPAQPLAQQGVDDAVAAGLRDRLAALDRALHRVEDGSYGRSVRSGLPIPDERLEADPAAELTVQEAAADQAANR